MRAYAQALKYKNDLQSENVTTQEIAGTVTIVTVTCAKLMQLLPKEIDCCNRATD
jgi:hypothetical protein